MANKSSQRVLRMYYQYSNDFGWRLTGALFEQVEDYFTCANRAVDS